VFNKYLAQQFGHPTGFLGRYLLGALWNRRNRALHETAFSCLDLSATDRVLEIGFGGGRLLKRMSSVVTQGRICGVDVSPAICASASHYCRQAVRRGAMELRCADAVNIPYPDAAFDKVCSVNSLFYWSDPRRVFTEAARVLREDGLFVLIFTDRESLAKKGFAGHGLQLMKERDVREMLKSAGFQTVEVREAVDTRRHYLCLTGHCAKMVIR